MTDITLVKTIILRAPPERVWEFLTEPELLARWFHEGNTALRAGEPFELLRENPVTDDPRMLWGEVLEAEKPKRLLHTFRYHGQAEGLESQVEWTLESLFGGTKLTLTHKNSATSAEDVWVEAKDTDSGWDEYLFRLRSVFS